MNYNQIKQITEQAVQDKVFPGCVVGIVDSTGRREYIVSGKHTYDSDAPVIAQDVIFDVASITKAIPTASLACALVDSGKLRLDDKLIAYVPEFKITDRESATIWHLLTHSLDFGEMFLSRLKDKTSKEILDYIFTRELQSRAGEKLWYMNATSILLGLVVQRIWGRPLDQIAQEKFFGPLGMSRTTFHPEGFDKREIVPTEMDPWRGRLIHGEVHDESAHVLRKEFIPGHAGLFSTVPDLLVFLEMLINKGRFNGKQYFSESMVKMMLSNQLLKTGDSHGLGWEINQPEFMGKHASAHTFGKTGFTGCVVVGDTEKQVAFAFLSNAVHPKRPASRDGLNRVRRLVADVILG